jgi:ribosomal protein L37E
MFTYVCKNCGGYSYSASNEREDEPCIYCDYPSTVLVLDEDDAEEGEEMEDKIFVHVCIAVSDDCQNFEDSYGEICVRCNRCGRFNGDDNE